MMHRAQIGELSFAVNDMLTRYVEVHNGIFANPWWTNLPIPGLFKAIDCPRYSLQITEVAKKLHKIREEAASLYTKAQPDERTYVAKLNEYIDALLGAVSALAIVVNNLKAKADGGAYSRSEYKHDVITYQMAERRYHALGEEMNNQWLALSKSKNEVADLDTLWEEYTLRLADEILLSAKNGPEEAFIKAVGTLAQVIYIITADEQRDETVTAMMNVLRTYLSALDDLRGTKVKR